MYRSVKSLTIAQVLGMLLCTVLFIAPKAMALELGNVEMHDVHIKSSTANGAISSLLNAMVEQGLKQARKKAEDGDAEAQNTLGEAYQSGQGIAQSNKEAAKWFQRAADQDNAKAQYHLSLMYKSGSGVIRDANKALQLLHQAAEHNHAQAQYQLAAYYLSKKDTSNHLKWLKISAHNSFPRAMNSLGVIYIKGKLAAKDDVMGFSLLQRAAKAGVIMAMENVSWCYQQGVGVELNDEQSVFWLTKAAEKGSAEAQFQLGVSQENNISWITKSAEQGFPAAQGLLGMMYISGKGAKENARTGFYWLLKAEDGGNKKAGNILNTAAHCIQQLIDNKKKEQSK